VCNYFIVKKERRTFQPNEEDIAGCDGQTGLSTKVRDDDYTYLAKLRLRILRKQLSITNKHQSLSNLTQVLISLL